MQIFSSVHIGVIWVGDKHILGIFLHFLDLFFLPNEICLVVFFYLHRIVVKLHSFEQLNITFPFSQLFINCFFHILQISDHLNSFFNLSFWFRIFWVGLFPGELDVFVRDCNKARSVFKWKSSKIAWWSINKSLILVQGSSFLLFFGNFVCCFFLHGCHLFSLFIFRILVWFRILVFLTVLIFIFILVLFLFLVLRAWISNDLHIFDHVVPHPHKMHLIIHSIAWPPNIPVEFYIEVVIFFIIAVLCWLPPIHQDIWVAQPPQHCWRVAGSNISRNFSCLHFVICPILEFWNIEEFIISSDFVLEFLFEFFLCLP